MKLSRKTRGNETKAKRHRVCLYDDTRHAFSNSRRYYHRFLYFSFTPFYRFINRSDNGANFKGAQKEFQDAIAEIKIPKVASESVKNMLILSGHLTQQVAHGWEWPGKHL